MIKDIPFFRVQPFLAQINYLFFSKKCNNSDLVSFGHFWTQTGNMEFSPKIELCHFLAFKDPNSIYISKMSKYSILRKVAYQRTDE